MKKILEILKEFININLAVIVFTLLPIAVLTLITFKTDLLLNFRSFIVLTGSMQPLIEPGSIIYTQKQSFYNLGDIIAFEKNGNTITHRVVDIKRKDNRYVYFTKGDANNVTDSDFVVIDKVIGKAQFHLPLVGRFIADLKSLKGVILFIFIPSLIFILLELWNIKNEIEKETEKRILKKLQEMQSVNIT